MNINYQSILLTVFTVMSLATTAHAGYAKFVEIDKVMIDHKYGDKLFIKLKNDVIVKESPACSVEHNSGWHFVMPLDTKLNASTITSFLLTAKTAKNKLHLRGTDECDLFRNIETLRRIEVLQ